MPIKSPCAEVCAGTATDSISSTATVTAAGASISAADAATYSPADATAYTTNAAAYAPETATESTYQVKAANSAYQAEAADGTYQAEGGRREKNAALLRAAKAGDAAAREQLVCDNLPLVHRIARRFCGRGTDYDDLCQIGAVGMMRAIDGFDLSLGTAFSTYAVPLIIGEIKRHLRDDGPIKVGRGLRRLGGMLMRERELFMAQTGREPRISELAARCSVTQEEAAEALEACSEISSLSAPFGEDGLTLEGSLPDPSDRIADRTDRIALAQALSELSGRERQIITLRYYGGLSQKQTGEQLGLSQVKISREEKKILGKLKTAL